MKTIRIKIYRFAELSKTAQATAIRNYERYNAPNMPEAAIIERLSNPIYQFVSNGDMYNGLTN